MLQCRVLPTSRGRCFGVAPLLQITGTTPVGPDSCWVQVSCVGRLSIDTFDEEHEQPHDIALVSTYDDEDTRPASVGMDDWMEPDDASPELAATYLHSVHAACCDLTHECEVAKGADAVFFGGGGCGGCELGATCSMNAN